MHSCKASRCSYKKAGTCHEQVTRALHTPPGSASEAPDRCATLRPAGNQRQGTPTSKRDLQSPPLDSALRGDRSLGSKGAAPPVMGSPENSTLKQSTGLSLSLQSSHPSPGPLLPRGQPPVIQGSQATSQLPSRDSLLAEQQPWGEEHGDVSGLGALASH